MPKTMLLTVALAACAVPTSSESDTESASVISCEELNDGACREDHPDYPEPPTDNGPTCRIKGDDIPLDTLPANVDDYDGKVSYCHATSSATNPFVIITTSTSACKAHDDHTKLTKGGEEDQFGTDGCED